MSVGVALRSDLDLTLGSLRDRLLEDREGRVTEPIVPATIHFTDDSIDLGAGREVPRTSRGIEAFGSMANIPTAFLHRLGDTDHALQASVLTRLLSELPTVAVEFSPEDGVVSVTSPSKVPVDPIRLVGLAERVLGTEEGVVQRLINTPGEFAFDVHVPVDYDRGIGGDGQMVEVPSDLLSYSWASRMPLDGSQRVGDLTAGGLRVGVDLRHGLTPYVQPWLMRLACTNGMEATQHGLRVDGRGLSVDDVLIDLEVQARKAFGEIEDAIQHFYRLRETPEPQPERMLIHLAEETNMPQRSLQALLRTSAHGGLPENPTTFDMVNLVTNQANRTRNNGGRLILERAGGFVVHTEAARCDHCRALQN